METRNELTANIRAALKKEYPEWKFSVTHSNGSSRSVTVALMSGPRDVYVKNELTPGNTQVNHYYIDHYSQAYANEWPQLPHHVILTDEAVTMLKRVSEISNKTNWNRSDIQSDYFDVNFYFHLDIGKWDKPYTVKA